jgi:putative ABC transport system permease protein
MDQADVCVLGYQTAEDLFEGDDPIGETVWINRKPCEVIGVIAELEVVDVQQRAMSRVNDGFYLPISTAVHNLFDTEPWVSILAHVTDESRVDEAKAQIAAYLRQRHAIEQTADGKYQDDFRMTTKQDVLGAQQEAARTFALLLTALAAVSLVVGGIGIMNVMLVSVTERTREIGVRMAVGARRRDIVSQFLLEAVLLSAGGGLLGIAVGVLAIPIAASLNHGAALLDVRSIPLAIGVALLTGIVFGLYPAVRASRLDPIEALRYE